MSIGTMSNKRRVLKRRGVIVAVTLVCLLVVATLGAALVRAMVDHRRESMRNEHRVQAFWLAESAIDRAASQLASSPDYEGETWQIDRDSLGGRWSGSVLIRVEKTGTDEQARKVIVQSRYPEDAARRVTERIEVVVKSSVSGESS
jgi:type II secretory pathway component PulK